MPWLFKTEPDTFSFADLLAAPQKTTVWDGVRNYQARNFMREMRVGDTVLIYHSSTAQKGVAGRARVVRESYPDPTQFDPASPHYDPKATPDAPRWDAVAIEGVAALPRLVTLAEMKAEPALEGLRLLQRGNRLSVMPLSEADLEGILHLAEEEIP
jgi:predicted RNA-binding protein with PUA-like domain